MMKQSIYQGPPLHYSQLFQNSCPKRKPKKMHTKCTLSSWPISS